MEKRLLDLLDKHSQTPLCHNIAAEVTEFEFTPDQVYDDVILPIALNQIDFTLSGVPQQVIPNGYPSSENDLDYFFQHISLFGIQSSQDLVEHNTPYSGSCITQAWFLRHYHYNHYPDAHEKTPHYALDEIPPNTKYVYPVLVPGNGFYTSRVFLSGWYTGFFPQRVIEDARNGLCKILYHCSHEGHGKNLTWVKELFVFLSRYNNIPFSSFGFLDGNYLTPALQEQYGSTGFYHQFFESFTAGQLHSNSKLREENFDDRSYAFTHLNRRKRTHRLATVYAVQNMPNVLWTYLDDDNYNRHFENFFDEVLDEEFEKKLPRSYDIDKTVNDTRINDIEKEAYFSFVNETNFYDSTSLFLTEKTFKPIACMKPFILASQAGSLKLLRQMGYQTFSPWFDESYDDEPNPSKRLKKVLLEVDRICALSNAEQKQMREEMKTILISNRDNMLSRFDKNIHVQTVVKQIYDWVHA